MLLGYRPTYTFLLVVTPVVTLGLGTPCAAWNYTSGSLSAGNQADGNYRPTLLSTYSILPARVAYGNDRSK